MADIEKEEKKYVCVDDIIDRLYDNEFAMHCPLDEVSDVIYNTPTADVAEVRHGEWIDEFKSFNVVGSGGAERSYLVGYKCSLCGRSEISKEPYCNCGAKMDR